MRKKSNLKKNELVEDYEKRINLKSKRKKTLVRKIMEFSQMIGIDIYLVMHDGEMNRVITYSSGTKAKGLFTSENASQVMDHARRGFKYLKELTDDDYLKFCKNINKPEEDNDPGSESTNQLKRQRMDMGLSQSDQLVGP